MVAKEAHADAPARVDRFFALWAEADAQARNAALAELTTPDVSFRDRWGCVDGRDELADYLAAVQAFAAGTLLKRDGEVSECQGTALADWTVTAGGGAAAGRGTNVFTFAPDGRIRCVVGLRRG